jgi:hypothetical protein
MNATTANSEFVVVGGNCLADFLGHKDPEALVKWFEYMLSAVSACEEESLGGGGGGGSEYVSLGEYLGWVAQDIRENGWLSGKAARACDRTSSSQSALHAYFEHFRKPKDFPRPTAADFDRGHAAIHYLTAYFETQDPAGLDDYMHNLYVLLRQGAVKYKTAGLAGSMIVTAERMQDKEVERRQFDNIKKTSTHQGQVGEKLTLKVKVTSIRELDGQFGVTTLIRFVGDGNAYTWFASGNKAEEWDVDGEIEIAATVKKHNAMNGLNETILTRVKELKKPG